MWPLAKALSFLEHSTQVSSDDVVLRDWSQSAENKNFALDLGVGAWPFPGYRALGMIFHFQKLLFASLEIIRSSSQGAGRGRA